MEETGSVYLHNYAFLHFISTKCLVPKVSGALFQELLIIDVHLYPLHIVFSCNTWRSIPAHLSESDCNVPDVGVDPMQEV